MKVQGITLNLCLHILSAKSRENISLRKRNPPGQVGFPAVTDNNQRVDLPHPVPITLSHNLYKQPIWQNKTILIIRISWFRFSKKYIRISWFQLMLTLLPNHKRRHPPQHWEDRKTWWPMFLANNMHKMNRRASISSVGQSRHLSTVIGIRHKKFDKNICSDLAYIIRTTTHRIYWKSFNSFCNLTAIVFNKDKFSDTLNIIRRQPNQLNHNEFISETTNPWSQHTVSSSPHKFQQSTTTEWRLGNLWLENAWNLQNLSVGMARLENDLSQVNLKFQLNNVLKSHSTLNTPPCPHNEARVQPWVDTSLHFRPCASLLYNTRANTGGKWLCHRQSVNYHYDYRYPLRSDQPKWP